MPTIEDFKTEIASNEEFRTAIVPILAEVPEVKTLMENFASLQVADKEQQINNKINNIFKESGFDLKDSIENTIADVVNEIKTLKQQGGNDAKVKALQDELKSLKEGGDNHWQKVHDEAVAKMTDEINKRESIISEMKDSYNKSLIKADLMAGLSGIELDSSIDKELITNYIDTISASLMNKATIVEGKIVYNNEEGKPVVNKNFSPATSKELWEEKLGKFKKKDAGGASRPTIGAIEGDGENKRVRLEKDTFETRHEFATYFSKLMASKGIVSGSPEYNKLYEQARKDYKIGELRLN